MTPEEAIIILYQEICDAMTRAGERIGTAPCGAPAEAVVASAISLFLDKSPETRRVLLAVLNQDPRAAQLLC